MLILQALQIRHWLHEGINWTVNNDICWLIKSPRKGAWNHLPGILTPAIPPTDFHIWEVVLDKRLTLLNKFVCSGEVSSAAAITHNVIHSVSSVSVDGFPSSANQWATRETHSSHSLIFFFVKKFCSDENSPFKISNFSNHFLPMRWGYHDNSLVW